MVNTITDKMIIGIKEGQQMQAYPYWCWFILGFLTAILLMAIALRQVWARVRTAISEIAKQFQTLSTNQAFLQQLNLLVGYRQTSISYKSNELWLKSVIFGYHFKIKLH